MTTRRKKNLWRWFWRRQVALWDAALTLSVWRWRTQRFLLLITGLGIMLAVLLITALPLFTSVTATAGIRGLLRAQSKNAHIQASATLSGISSDEFKSSVAQVNGVAQQDIRSYVAGAPQPALVTFDWAETKFFGVPMRDARPHLQLLQGRLPVANQNSFTDIEVAMTQTAAYYMHVKVGDTIQLNTRYITNQTGIENPQPSPDVVVNLHLVGIFRVLADDAYWNDYTLEKDPPIVGAPPTPYYFLSDQTSLLHLLDGISAHYSSNFGGFFANTESTLLLSYTLDIQHITASQLSDLIARLGQLQQDFTQNSQALSEEGWTGPITDMAVSGLAVPDAIHSGNSILEKYQGQLQITGTPQLLLSAQILCLILFFINMMIGALVEREQGPIAVMRSRGANRRQVAGSLIMQGGVICVVAGIAGPFLALGAVLLLGPFLLTPATRDSLNVLVLNASDLARAESLYSLGAIAIAFLTLLLTIFLAMRSNILTHRREEARSTRPPLWQRLRLDLLVALLAIGGYVVTYYLEITQQFVGVQGQALIVTPLELLAPILLILAGILGFLRLFPFLLRWLARLTQRRTGLTSMLALAQMERAPRQAMRMALLLGLASAFLLFSLIFAASQGQRANDLAMYQAVSDFSGGSSNLPVTAMTSTTSRISTPQDVLSNAQGAIAQAIARYRAIRGVAAVSAGSISYVYLSLNRGTQQASTWPTRLIAVDPATYAPTTYWNGDDDSQPLSHFTDLLSQQRAQAIQQGEVPAIVASLTWNQLGLSPGQTFHLSNEAGSLSPITYVAIAEVAHIPPVNDSVEGAILVDYESLIASQIHVQGMTQVTAIPQLNYVWLRANSADPRALSEIRAALKTPALALSNLMDRQALGGDHGTDPLSMGLLSIMGIGVAATLLLAFLANLLLPLLSVRLRQTHFAVLRALGTDPGQVRGMLTWELGIILGTALVLGLVFGAILAFTSVPPLVFTGAVPSTLITLSSSALYTLQQIIPVTIVMPLSLGLALISLVLLSLLALGLMTRLAQRPLMAQSLRLSED